MMYIERGSTWNKWDFHVHTPYSILNNQFGFDPDPEYKTDIIEFDNYVKKLFESALQEGIVGIGITDYFSIDGYKRIRNEYLNNPNKLAELFPDEGKLSKIQKIYLFPNIEFRLDTFVGDDEHSVNYHVFFSGDVDCKIIEERFLERLSFSHTPQNYLPISRRSIEQLGREYKMNNPKENRNNFLVGMEKVTISYQKILETLSECKDLYDKYFISIPVDEDLSTLKWDGRYSETRRILYSQCHFLMSSNIGTRNFALAEGHEEEQKREFGSIKPCIWGSDAHSYDRLFHPDKDRFCWIKAEPTFEGLQQTLYEPAERVRIQKDYPEEKGEHHLIDYIVFHDDRFCENKIFFSEGLTAIIGGKSTGKSILLRHIAKCVDAQQVAEKEARSFAYIPKLDVEAEVFWKDGVSGKRNIIYIPQSWLNRVVDESGSDTELNNMIKNILLQQPQISLIHNDLKDKIANIIDKTHQNIKDYVSHINEANLCEKKLNEEGRSEAFLSSISKLKKQREELSIEVGITDEVLQKYGDLEKKISEYTEFLDKINNEINQINFDKEPYVYLHGVTHIEIDGNHRYNFSNVPIVKDKLESIINNINKSILEIWKPSIIDIMHELLEKKNNINNQLLELNNEFEPLKQIIAKNDQLKKIDNQLKEENQRLIKALELETKRDDNLKKASELKTQVLSLRQNLLDIYNTFSIKLDKINSPNTDLVFKAQIENRQKDLFDEINGLFDNRNLRAFKDSNYSFTDSESLRIDDVLFETLWEAMYKGIIAFKGGSNMQSALERLFSDWFYVHYIVSSGRDTINSMSPGKKALVLLELIVNLENGQCPILIDQPEDDLDNRSIYNDLVKYLKTKKHERQIIVVTHNANVVLGADAEEVIIANQDAKELENHSKRFEYRSGAIENVSQVLEADGTVRKGVLYQKGIQQQICDILEGGKDAFEKRRNKYFNTNK